MRKIGSLQRHFCFTVPICCFEEPSMCVGLLVSAVIRSLNSECTLFFFFRLNVEFNVASIKISNKLHVLILSMQYSVHYCKFHYIKLKSPDKPLSTLFARVSLQTWKWLTANNQNLKYSSSIPEEYSPFDDVRYCDVKQLCWRRWNEKGLTQIILA